MSFENTVAEAAKWIRENENKSLGVGAHHYWTPSVLTKASSACHLRHDILTAMAFVTELVGRDLLLVCSVNNHDAYLINPHKANEWAQVEHPHFSYLKKRLSDYWDHATSAGVSLIVGGLVGFLFGMAL